MAGVEVGYSAEVRDVFRQVDDFKRERIPRAARKSLNAGLQVMVTGVRKAIPKAKTRGHSSVRLRRSVGKRVRRTRDGFYNGKLGIGVGKKKNDPRVARHAAPNVAGSQDRYTGQQQVRKRGKVTGHKQTGHARKFRGRNVPNDAVSIGVANSSAAASQRMYDVAERELEREPSAWERRNGIG